MGRKEFVWNPVKYNGLNGATLAAAKGAEMSNKMLDPIQSWLKDKETQLTRDNTGSAITRMMSGNPLSQEELDNSQHLDQTAYANAFFSNKEHQEKVRANEVQESYYNARLAEQKANNERNYESPEDKTLRDIYKWKKTAGSPEALASGARRSSGSGKGGKGANGLSILNNILKEMGGEENTSSMDSESKTELLNDIYKRTDDPRVIREALIGAHKDTSFRGFMNPYDETQFYNINDNIDTAILRIKARDNIGK